MSKYGFWKFFWDVVLILLTGGLWLLWIILRYLRTH